MRDALKIVKTTEPKILRSLGWKIEKPTIRPTIGLEEVEDRIRKAIFFPFKYPKTFEHLKIKPSRGMFSCN